MFQVPCLTCQLIYLSLLIRILLASRLHISKKGNYILLVPTIDGISLNAQPAIAFPFGPRPLVPHPCRGGDRGGVGDTS